ncbi:hypothetical protein Sru01_38020 [Sphaerisporangium rufum]|uniref:Regulator of SigK n=1 Tax=Sphaerisporangium rufum TaxID=1381558 RepID=A0A919R5T0_9ACTN|nr:anti-sigma factor [Sphaerisporangium rufum]GII78820.1 hypothetical protein Sru01_38020 [Sphaerisporangium rufum]
MRSDPHTLAGAYALHAVDDLGELAAIEGHLAGCPECAEEARGLRETAARLGAAVAVAPPPALRARVMAEIGLVRQLPPAVPPARAHAAPAAARSWWPRAATALAAACLAVAVGLGVVVVRTRDQLDAERDGGRRIAAVLAAPDSRSVTARTGAGGTATVVVSRSEQSMVFFSSGMAALPQGRTYQLWRIGRDGPRPDRLTRPDTAGRVPPTVLGGLGDATKVAVTVEPAGGSARPTTEPLLVLDLPRA